MALWVALLFLAQSDSDALIVGQCCSSSNAAARASRARVTALSSMRNSEPGRTHAARRSIREGVAASARATLRDLSDRGLRSW